MSKRIFKAMARRASILAAAVGMVIGATAGGAQAAEKESAYTVSLGFDFSSHFISYGADVWGGGGSACTFSPESTKFAYGTVTAAFSDQLSGFVNIWSDINDNAESNIGGSVQEIDLNIGATYTMDKWAFTLAHGCWWYAGDTEHIVDFTVAYNDGEQFTPGLSLNPSVTFHYRYEGNGSQDESWCLVPGIKPTFTIMKDSKYPLTISFPLNVAFFGDDFQGGDGGLGYFSGGIAVSVPLSFIPEKYGAWSVTGSATYYCTENDAIPNNPSDQFLVTAVSIGVTL